MPSGSNLVPGKSSCGRWNGNAKNVQLGISTSSRISRLKHLDPDMQCSINFGKSY